MSVLIIDSDKIYSDNFSKYLLLNNYGVLTVNGAQEAISKVDEFQPGIIVLEPLLTKNNGIEFLYELRSYSDWQSIPVIILSRKDDIDLAVSSKLRTDLGIVEVIYKPETSFKRIVEIMERNGIIS